MAGIYDWILNGLKTSQSPATNHLPTPIPAQNITGLPVPFQEMPSESSSFNPFTKLNEMFTTNSSNPTIPQDAGTNPMSPNDPLKTFVLQQFMSKAGGGSNQDSGQAKPVGISPATMMNYGNPTRPNFDPIPPSNVAPNAASPTSLRKQLIARMMAQQSPYEG